MDVRLIYEALDLTERLEVARGRVTGSTKPGDRARFMRLLDTIIRSKRRALRRLQRDGIIDAAGRTLTTPPAPEEG